MQQKSLIKLNNKAQLHEIHKQVEQSNLVRFVRRVDIPNQHAGLFLCVLENNVLHVVQHRT